MIFGVTASQATSDAVAGGGGSEPATPTDTWNPSDKHADITLSNDNLTATTAGVGVARCVRSTNSHATGKYYFEFRFDAIGADNFAAVGIARIGMGLTQFLGEQGGSAYSAGYHTDGFVWQNGTGSGTDTGKPLAVSEWGRIAVDLDAGKMWVGDSTGWVGDPEAGTGNTVSFSLGGAALFAACQGYSSGDSGIANFGFTAFNYTQPAGFSDWGA